MSYVIIRHRVKDFDSWKPVFDEHGSVRRESGSKGGHLYRNADDPNEVVVLFEWDNLNNARKFMSSEDLRKRMVRAGVVDKPDIYFLEDSGRSTA